MATDGSPSGRGMAIQNCVLSRWVQASLLTPLLGSDTSVRSRRVGSLHCTSQGAPRRELSSAFTGGATKSPTVLEDALRAKVLRHEVRGVFNSRGDLHHF